ncbi:MAG: helix-turn-helix domain-containing protein [Nitrospira sp.]|nr:helix-turn-helix domain-containing protein [Nitrospira sp.]
MRPTLLNVRELAGYLNVSEKSIRRAYRKGQIPFKRIFRCVRFDLEHVIEALQRARPGNLERTSVILGQRSATGGASRRRAQLPRPRLGKTGASIATKPRRK